MKRLFFALLIMLFAVVPCFAVDGSVSLANTRLGLVNGTAFVDFSAAGTLTPYLNWKLTLTDSAGKKAAGYIKAAGTSEGLGDELLANTSFDANVTGWSGTNASLASVAGGQSNNCLEVTRTDGTSQDAYPATLTTSVGGLYKMSAYVKSGTSGNEAYSMALYGGGWTPSHGSIAGTSSGTWTQVTFYRVMTKTTAIPLLKKNTATAGTMLFDETSVKAVTAPSATGVTITSTPGGTTYNWASVESGFNYNDASGYTYTIIPRFVGGGLGLGIIYGF